MVRLTSGRWTRCGRRPTELHHRLTRARGGLILDAAGETYHLINLCVGHHKTAHDEGTALRNGLLLDGYVTTGPDGLPEYRGSDPHLRSLYGREVDLPDLSGVPGGAGTG
jgi:hypothetical protein